MNDLISKVLRESLDSFILFETDEVDEPVEGGIKKETGEIKRAKDAVVQRMKTLASQNDKDVLDILDNLGVNPSYTASDYRNSRNDAFQMNGMISRKVSDDVQKIIFLLRKYVSNDGSFYDDRLRKKYPNDFNYIMKMKDMIDQCGLSHTYDPSANKPDAQRYGIQYDKNSDEYNFDNFDFNNIDDKHTKYWRGNSERRNELSDFEAVSEIKSSIVDKYMRAKYGMRLEMPNNVFAIGNGKLPKTTMIVNFTSAYRCPAWNECLVKHACYARSGEHRLGNVKDANDERSSMWLSTKNDPELLELVKQLLKTYVVDYSKAFKLLNKKSKLSKEETAAYIDNLRNKHLSELSEEEKNAIIKCRRITDIRLNENGDFVGQWLIDEWDKIAGELKMIGVNTTAYTCRHLNFEGVKNIVINASQMSIKGGAVARYFYCVSEDVYDALDETYPMKGDKVVVGKDDSIDNTILPLYKYNRKTNSLLKPSGKFYYKCPCGRSSTKGSDKISCYQCNICYSPNQGSAPYYVFVKAHGSARTMMPDRIPGFGVSENFFNNYKGDLGTLEADNVAESKTLMNEGSEVNMAYNQITNNAINSVYDHMDKLYNQQI